MPANLQQTTLCEGYRRAVAGYHEMVENPHVHKRERLAEALCEGLIGMAGFADTGGMIVRKNNCGCIALKDQFDYLARVNRGLKYNLLTSEMTKNTCNSLG